MSERWHDYVAGAIEQAGSRPAAAYHTWTYMAPLLDRIRTRLRPGARVLELGCGAGFHAVLLAAWGFEVIGIDSDERIVGLARETADFFGETSARFEVADALTLTPGFGKFDLAFSLGLIEHFDRDVAADLLARQGHIADAVAAVIPTKHLHHATTPTDERFYSARGFEALFVEAGLRIDETFAFGDVPTALGLWGRRLLPHALYRLIQVRLGYAMDLCVIGRAGRS